MGVLAETRGGVTVEVAYIDARQQELDSYPIYDVETRPMIETTRKEYHVMSGGQVIDRQVRYDTTRYNDNRIIRSTGHRWVWFYTMKFADDTTPKFMIQDQVGLRINDYVGVIDYRWFGIRTREFLHIRTNAIAYQDDAPKLPDRRAATTIAALATLVVTMHRDVLDMKSAAIGVSVGILFHVLRCTGPVLHQMMRRIRSRSAYRMVHAQYAEMVEAAREA